MSKDETFTKKNVRIVRPGYGLSPKYYKDILGRKVSQDVEKGTALAWDLVNDKK